MLFCLWKKIFPTGAGHAKITERERLSCKMDDQGMDKSFTQA
jgi:hypothetical protein